MLMLTDLLFVVGADLWLKWRSERRFTYLRTCVISAGVACVSLLTAGLVRQKMNSGFYVHLDMCAY